MRNKINRQWISKTLSLAMLPFYGPVKQSQQVTRTIGIGMTLTGD